MQIDLKKEFLEPSDEFTPIPFWFWNDHLEETEISRQINDFKAKGVMGFVIHPRMGIPQEIQYLSDRFMALVKYAVDEASRLGMKVVLYDEAMYPSGSAHGMVVKDHPEFASRGIRMAEYVCSEGCGISAKLYEGETIISVQAVEKLSPDTINPDSITKIELKDGKAFFQAPSTGQWHVVFFIEGFTQGTIRGVHEGEDDGEPNAPPSGDLMNPAAMERFIELTYVRYYEVLKEHFGSTVSAMFTDEPSLVGRCSKKVYKPWTTDFLDWYEKNSGHERDLPLLWFETEDGRSAAVRKIYGKAVNKRLEYSYYSQISRWCQEHGISLTGHPHASDEIGFLKHFHIPGQDIVWRWVAPENGKGIEGSDSTMGKCSSDAARHGARRRNSNECFGCCGPDGIQWGFSCDDMKWYMDWLFVRGVNLLYPHAFFYSVRGEIRYGERPPDVGPNNIWWKYYKNISDYIKRMSWLMTDSVNITEVAVLCEGDFLPWRIVKPLYQHQVEFNYLEDSLILSDSCNITDGHLCVQKQKYRLLLVEKPEMLTRKLCERLGSFMKDGGRVIVYNEGRRKTLPDGFIEINCLDAIIHEIENSIPRDILFSPANQDLRISHVEKDGIHFYLLVNEGENEIAGNLSIMKNGNVEIWNPWQGTCEKPEIIHLGENGICIPFCLQRRESSIVCMDPSQEPEQCSTAKDFPMSEPAVDSSINIGDSWRVWGLPAGSRPDIQLESWTQWNGMENFTGTVTYQSDFELKTEDITGRMILDLGEIREIAHLYINGTDAGFKLWVPFTFDITALVKPGRNTLSVEVTNSPANHFSGARLPSGLLGPVRLKKG